MSSDLSYNICLSILSADVCNIWQDTEKLLSNLEPVFQSSERLLKDVLWLHIDIMDGHFVPNISFGPGVVGSLRSRFEGTLDVHLMTTQPETWIRELQNVPNPVQLTFHWEAVNEDKHQCRSVVSLIAECGKFVGIAVKPKTDPQFLENFIEGIRFVEECYKIQTILVMTVEPGFGGQSFMKSQLPVIQYIRSTFPFINIQVDGGLDSKTVELAVESGANVIVAGTSLFRATDPAAVASVMKNVCQQHFIDKTSCVS